jgi:hypothetical protein
MAELTGSVGRGFLLSLLLHPAALVLLAIMARAVAGDDGALVALVVFLAAIGLTQWIYLTPVAWRLRRRGATATAKGVVIGGCVVTLGSTLCYGGMGLKSLQNAADDRRFHQDARDHPRDSISTDGVVTAVDDAHFELRREDGTVVSLRTWPGLDYILLKKDGGYEKRTRDILKPGVRVRVDYSQERGKPPDSASIVRVYEEGATRE